MCVPFSTDSDDSQGTWSLPSISKLVNSQSQSGRKTLSLHWTALTRVVVVALVSQHKHFTNTSPTIGKDFTVMQQEKHSRPISNTTNATPTQHTVTKTSPGAIWHFYSAAMLILAMGSSFVWSVYCTLNSRAVKKKLVSRIGNNIHWQFECSDKSVKKKIFPFALQHRPKWICKIISIHY